MEIRITFNAAAEQLAADFSRTLAVIRRQDGVEILWYVRPIRDILYATTALARTSPLTPLNAALQLHEYQSVQPIRDDIEALGLETGVVLEGDRVIGAVSSQMPTDAVASSPVADLVDVSELTTLLTFAPSGNPGTLGWIGEPDDRAALEDASSIDDEIDIASTLGSESAGAAAAAAPPPARPIDVPKGTSHVAGSRLGADKGADSPGTASIGPRAAASAPGPVRGEAAPVKPEDQAARTIDGFPDVRAPAYVQMGAEFDVEVGLETIPLAGVQGGLISIPVQSAAEVLDVAIEVIADGFDAPNGTRTSLAVAVASPFTSRAKVRLRARPLDDPAIPRLGSIEIRYVFGGAICGTASRPIVVGSGSSAPPPRGNGEAWTSRGPTAGPVNISTAGRGVDLTIEITKPNGNSADGRFACRLYSPHPIAIPANIPDIDLGDDAKTFARDVVAGVRRVVGDALAELTLEAKGRTVASKLPRAVFDALNDVWTVVARVPTVLIVTDDPYVPWEIAWVDRPAIDAGSPSFLGAQTIIGRWLRPPSEAYGPPSPGPSRPPTNPPASIPVHRMAAMAGVYKAATGFRALPNAETEVAELVTSHSAIRLDASRKGVMQLLTAQVPGPDSATGPVDAAHLAGHGDFDAAVADSSVFILSDGSELPSDLFLAARYGDPQQPFLFLNACMIGVGGELLGNFGGYPGNALRGGFGAVIGALWEVDDTVAHNIAAEFWRRALGGAGRKPEAVGAILRDIRTRFVAAPGGVAQPTYLSYVFYGHPELMLA